MARAVRLEFLLYYLCIAQHERFCWALAAEVVVARAVSH